MEEVDEEEEEDKQEGGGGEEGGGDGGKKRIEMSDKHYKLDVEKYILGAYCWRLRRT